MCSKKVPLILRKLNYQQSELTKTDLKSLYDLELSYINLRHKLVNERKLKIRDRGLPEEISENIIKFILQKLGDDTSTNNTKGDLYSQKEGIQECKSFTSDGPISFSPTSKWDVIYFLDARFWTCNKFTLYRVNLSNQNPIWQNISMNKEQTFQDQCVEKRRPRIGWENLHSQLGPHCEQVFSGNIDEILC